MAFLGNYSILRGLAKSVKYAALFLVAGLIIGLPAEWKELTIGGLLIFVFNFLKVRFGIKIPLLDFEPKKA